MTQILPALSDLLPPSPDPLHHQIISAVLAERREIYAMAVAQLDDPASPLYFMAERLIGTLRQGKKVLLAGNGGSAAEAQHFSAELVGRFQRERDPYAALALTTDTSILTAVSNDYGYVELFARQIRALGCAGDMAILFSTSGESENLVRAAHAAHAHGIYVAAVTGSAPSRLERASDVSLRVAAQDTGAIQELHTLVTHLLCTMVEHALLPERSR